MKRAISPGSSISGKARRGSGTPVGVRVTGIFALTSFQRPSNSRPNCSSVRARFTCSRTNLLYFSIDSTTCPSLLIVILSKLTRIIHQRQDPDAVFKPYRLVVGSVNLGLDALQFLCAPCGRVEDPSYLPPRYRPDRASRFFATVTGCRNQDSSPKQFGRRSRFFE